MGRSLVSSNNLSAEQPEQTSVAVPKLSLAWPQIWLHEKTEARAANGVQQMTILP